MVLSNTIIGLLEMLKIYQWESTIGIQIISQESQTFSKGWWRVNWGFSFLLRWEENWLSVSRRDTRETTERQWSSAIGRARKRIRNHERVIDGASEESEGLSWGDQAGGRHRCQQGTVPYRYNKSLYNGEWEPVTAS